jgi:hypothetical protein
MSSLEREKLEMLARRARTLREVWLGERQERLALQQTANAEVRKRWMESESSTEERKAWLARRSE